MILILSALAAPAVHGTIPEGATPASKPSAADDGVAPWDRYLAGKLYTGVYNVHDAEACSAKGARALAGDTLVSPGSTVLGIEHDGLLTNWLGALQTWHQRFIEAGDMVAMARHTCVGVVDTGSANATSYFKGYMLFDPRAMVLANQGEGVKIGRVEAVLAHEYAHQLQYWHGSVFQGERSDRRTELTADCMAGAILATEGAQSTDLGPVTMYAVEEGVAGAFAALGDSELTAEGHHGTPAERDKLARAGVRIAIDHYKAGGKRWALHSGALKSACEKVVIQSDSGSVLMHPSELLEKRTPHPVGR